jgi:transglutaminase-like putative cysteine protease
VEGAGVKRLLGWIVHKLGLPTLLSLALLLVALSSLALGLASVVRSLDTGLLLSVVGYGMLVGWVLARLPLPGWLAGVLASGLGIDAIIMRVGHLRGTWLTLPQVLADLAWAIWRWPLVGPPDRLPFVLALAGLWADLNTLLMRVRNWLVALAAGRPTFDPVAVALVWSLVLWAVAAWAGWAVRRRQQPLQGVTPAGVLLAASLAYGGGTAYFLLPLLGAALLLMALVGHAAREERWQASGVDFSLDIRLDLALTATSLALILVATAALAPSVSVRQVVSFAQRLLAVQAGQANPVAGSLGLEPRPGQATVFDAARAPGLPRRHLLGSGPELSERVVMVISTGELPSSPPGAVTGQSPPRYYWRSLTYDWYTGRGWLAGPTETAQYKAGEPVISESTPLRRMLWQEVRAVGNLGGLLYVTGDLVTADHDYEVAWRSAGDAFGASIGVTAYRAESLVPVASEAQLRLAGSDYPEWVVNRYLALPDEVPARVLALARDLTATAPSPYDRARAIETYLRTFPYTLDLPTPPVERDVADYFLFDLRQGYCDYYATAMVVLARAAGLPARLVTGYASGTYDMVNARYVVTEADAHSWVEVYFPGYGWVEFEPTAGRPPIERPGEIIPEGRRQKAEGNGGYPSALRLLTTTFGLLLSVFCLLILAGIVWLVTDAWRLRRLSPVAAVATLYERLRRHGRRLAVPGRPGDTPYEFAASFIKHMADLAHDGRWGRMLTPAAQEVRWLTDLCVRSFYSPYPPGVTDQVQAIQTWQRLRRRLWLVGVWRTERRILRNQDDGRLDKWPSAEFDNPSEMGYK